MRTFGHIPAEPRRITTLDDCAPKFAAALLAALADVSDTLVFETLRTNERQTWLYGFGRDYDDGRGLVTHASTAEYGWHIFGASADVIHVTKGWDAPDSWWRELGEAYERHGLTWGGRWKMRDLPHSQWGRCRTTPSDEARRLYHSGGNPAVWQAIGAD